jgi:xylulokinase
MRGGFINLSLETERVDLVRSVTEGVAHNLAWLLPHVEAFTGDDIGEFAFVGGAARSPRWCQVLADVLDRPIAPAADPDTAVARAVARLALARSGELDRAEVDDGVELAARYEPRSERRAMYDMHQEQFEAAFEALRPISEALTSFHAAQIQEPAP